MKSAMSTTFSSDGDRRSVKKVRIKLDDVMDVEEESRRENGIMTNEEEDLLLPAITIGIDNRQNDSDERAGKKCPSPSNPQLKTCTGNTGHKKFTVINYGDVQPGIGSGIDGLLEKGESCHPGKERRGGVHMHTERRGSLITSDKRVHLPERRGSLEPLPDRRGSVFERRGSFFRERRGTPSQASIGTRSEAQSDTCSRDSLDFHHPNSEGNLADSGRRPSLDIVSTVDLRIPMESDTLSLQSHPKRSELRRASIAQSQSYLSHRRPSLTPTIADFHGSEDLYDLNSNHNKRRNSGLRLDHLALPMPMINLNDSKLDSTDGHEKSWHSGPFKLIDVARRGRLFAKRKKARLIAKDGDCNVHYLNLEQKGSLIFSDIFTTFLNMKWRYNIIMFTTTFLITWVLFGLMWWALIAARTDADGNNPCVPDVYDFPTALLFSIETQATIGYGTRAITPACPMGFFLIMFQTILSVFVLCVCSGIIFAKVARPKRRAGAFLFSKYAVINQIDGQLCLVFRLGDQRNSQVIGVTINAQLVCTKITDEGEIVDMHQTPLKLSTVSDDQFYFLAWPVKVVHKIDEDSPLYNLSAEELILQEFEIIIILDATCETTGMTTQVRSSYLPSEILWGYRLAPLGVQKTSGGHYVVDFQHFHDTLPVETPEACAHDLYKARQAAALTADSVFAQ